MTTQSHFDAALFTFLEALRSNNNRSWFQAHRPCYETAVRGPMLRFIGDTGPRLWQISPRFVADARPNGRSLFRIHRDVRFAQDKRPYKTNAGAHFRHEAGRDAHAPGFYLHLEPGRVFIASGVWHPDRHALTKIRDAIVAYPRRWQRVISSNAFHITGSLGGDALKRHPSGYDPEHPLLADLKRKDYIVLAHFTEEQACAPDFLHVFIETCQTFAPLTHFLTTALELPW